MKTWLFRIESHGTAGEIIPAGSSGAMATHYTRPDKIRETAAAFHRATGGGTASIWAMPDAAWTQRACELPPAAFVDHVKRHGRRVF